MTQTEWQPIEIAPMDGTKFLIGYSNLPDAQPDDKVWEAIWNERQQSFTSLNGFLVHDYATHWMPLPAPPVKP